MFLKCMQKELFLQKPIWLFYKPPNMFLKVITADLGVAEVTEGFTVV